MFILTDNTFLFVFPSTGVAVSTSIMYDDAELEERPDKPEAVNYAGASVDSDDRGSLVSPVRSAERSTSAGSMATAGRTQYLMRTKPLVGV